MKSTTSHIRRIGAVCIAVALVALPGCANGGTTSGPAGGQADQAAAPVPPFIPAAKTSLYEHFDSVPLIADPLADYTAPTGPLRYCLNESYTGNTFRVGPPLGSDGMFKAIVDQLQAEGLASGPLITTDANNNATVQLSQMNNMIQQGCNVIITYPISASGLCSAADAAYAKGILVVSYGTEASCKHIISVNGNNYQLGYKAAANLADRLGGKGNVVLVNAIKGVPAAESLRAGALAAFQEKGDFKIIGEINGDWTPSVAKAQMLQFLATHPGKIDGVWQAGLMAPAVYEAMQQAGRADGVAVETMSATCAELAFWHQQGGDNWAYIQAGEPFAYLTMEAIMRILGGAKPVANVLLVDPPTVTPQNLSDWYQPGMTLQTECYPNVPAQYQPKGTQFDELFTNLPTQLPELKYATGPTF